MNPMIVELVQWCEREREKLRQGVDLMKGGILRTHEQSLTTGRTGDTTAANLADSRAKIAELDELLRKITAEHGTPTAT